jgi:hypothetical protein
LRRGLLSFALLPARAEYSREKMNSPVDTKKEFEFILINYKTEVSVIRLTLIGFLLLYGLSLHHSYAAEYENLTRKGAPSVSPGDGTREPLPGVLVYDSFSSDRWLSSHLSDTGSGWRLWTAGGFSRGDIGILKGVASYNGQDVVFLSDAVPGRRNYAVEADFILGSSKKTTGRLALLAQADTASGTAYWLGYDHSTRRFELYRLDPEGESELGAWSDGSLLPVTHRVTLEVTECGISVYIGGEKIMGAADTRITESGRAGIGVGASGNHTAVDNFTVRMISPGTDPPPSHRGATDPDIGVRTVSDFPRYSQQVHVKEPMVLAQPYTEYVLQSDIVAPETAFFIAADHVTLNLNGHTIIYGAGDPGKPVYGVRATKGDRRGVAIVNGRIEQAPALGADNPHYERSHAVFGGYDLESGQSNFRGFLAAGLEIHYRTPTTCGIYNHWGHESEIRHNSIRDTGRTVSSRNQLWAAIKLAEGSGQLVHHNRIIGARHGGVMVKSNAKVFHNIIEVDSADTNALGINAYAGENVEVYNNTIIGRGVHTSGIYFGAGGSDIRIFKNHVETCNTRPTVSPSDGYQSSSAFRTNFGLENAVVYDNTFLTWGKKNGVASGIDTRGWAMIIGLAREGDSLLIHDNTILGLSEDGEGMAYAVGIKANAVSGVRFEGNIIESNYGNISLGDSYGPSSGYPVFRENTLVKSAGYPAYANYTSVDMNEYRGYESTGIMFGNSYQGGADLHSIDWPSSPSTAALRDLGIGWIYTLIVEDADTAESLSGVSVSITDANGTVVFDEETDDAGRIQAELIEYWITNSTAGEPNSPFPGANREDVGPYTVIVGGGEPRLLEIHSNLSETAVLDTRTGP